MATIYSQNFDSLSTAAIAGQDSWVNGTNGSRFSVGTTLPYAGAKGVQSTTAGTDANVYRVFTMQTSGILNMQAYLRKETSGYANMSFYEGGTTRAQISLNLDDSAPKIKLYAGATTSVDTGVAGTWYLAELELDIDNELCRARVDSGTWTSWVAISGTLTTGIDRVRFGSADGAAAAAYHDELIITHTAPSITINPSTQVVVSSIPTYAVQTGLSISPSAQVISSSIPTYSVLLGNTISPDTQIATFSIPTYTVEAGDKTVSPDAQVATFSIPTFSILTGLSVSPSTQVIVASVPTYSVALGIDICPETQVLTFDIPTLAKVGSVWSKTSRPTNATWSRSSRNST